MNRNEAAGVLVAGLLSISMVFGGSILTPDTYAQAGQYRSLTLNADPTAAVYDSSHGYVYIATAAGTVAVIQGTSVIANLTLQYFPQSLAYDPTNGYVYAASAYPIGFHNGTISIISGRTIVGNITVGSYPRVFYNRYSRYVYCLQSDFGGVSNGRTLTNNYVSVISGTQILATMSVGHGSASQAIDSNNGYVYVANGDSGTVSVISGIHLVGTVNLGFAPGTFGFGLGFDLTYDNATGELYIAAPESPTYKPHMFTISGVNISASFAGFSAPILYDPVDKTIYAMQGDSMTTISVLSGTKAVANVTIPAVQNSTAIQTSLFYDPYDTQVYVIIVFVGLSGHAGDVTARIATILESAVTKTRDFPVSGSYPTILMANPSDQSLYLSGISQNTVTIIPSATGVPETTSASAQTSSEISQTITTGSGTTPGNSQPATSYTSYLFLALIAVAAMLFVAVLIARRFRGRSG